MMPSLGSMTVVASLLVSLLATAGAASQPRQVGAPAEHWVTVWAASAHGPYPIGNPSAQPDQRFAFPVPEAGADDQTLRLIVRPDRWGARIRLRFSNAFGSKPLALDAAYVGLQASAGRLVAGTNQPVRFSGSASVVIAPGQTSWSDAVRLPFVHGDGADLDGRRLAVSVHVTGTSGPMTWHAKALTTSYVSAPRSGSVAAEESDSAFPYTSASWFFLDAIDVMAPPATQVVVCFGDSITDGTNSTMNGDDRYPDALSHRLHAALGTRVSVVNAGIGGNLVTGPANYASAPAAGGPGALDRLARDVLDLSGVTSVVWLEGINDLAAGVSPDAVMEGFRRGVDRLHARGLRVVGATLTSALNAASATHGSPDVDRKRRALNEFIRTSGVFDGVADFDAATIDAATGALRAEFQPNSTIGGAGDRLHPNRAGYAAMAASIDLRFFTVQPGGRREP